MANKICLEVMMSKEALSNLSISAKTEVWGGNVSRVDFNGNSFELLERYEEFITPIQLAVLNSKVAYKKRMQQAINKILSDILEEAEWENEEEEC
ncbi:hypothetical protein [Conservatibacter flavescens]|uniref:Uncharacterized protein n=1 Tax=Conservatibacter flavescens TaxID=28161 RepID=A0A2M8S4Y4_9PAST|nr:hypothetical protein [Conservatibacter flavescens]PJG86193.1 hypothetical protein CVP05_03210 [Conservatibacter flavescens]